MSLCCRFARCFLFLMLLLTAAYIDADEIRPAYLQLTETNTDEFEVFFRVPARGENQRLSLHVQFDKQTQNLLEPWGGFESDAHNQRWVIQRAGGMTGTMIEIGGLQLTNTEVLLRIAYLDGSSTTHRFTPNTPVYTVSSQPGRGQIAWTYLVLGIEHILFGIDHILFVFVLLLLVRSVPKLIATITAFTLAHSVTLVLAALKLVSVPVPPMEACIALSIVFVATEIIRGHQGRPGITARYPWVVAFSFGLLHGLGFAAALGEIGLPQNAIAMSLILFNIGVEIGQLVFVFGVLALWRCIRLFSLRFPHWLERVPPYVIGSLASFWVFERVASFAL